MFNTNKSKVEFNNWALALDLKLLAFQVAAPAITRNEYLKTRNCVMFDYEIHRLRKFNNPCKSCGIPMHLTNNFEIFLVGQVCHTCWDINAIISANKYFYELHQAAQKEKYRNQPNRPPTAGA